MQALVPFTQRFRDRASQSFPNLPPDCLSKPVGFGSLTFRLVFLSFRTIFLALFILAENMLTKLKPAVPDPCRFRRALPAKALKKVLHTSNPRIAPRSRSLRIRSIVRA